MCGDAWSWCQQAAAAVTRLWWCWLTCSLLALSASSQQQQQHQQQPHGTRTVTWEMTCGPATSHSYIHSIFIEELSSWASCCIIQSLYSLCTHWLAYSSPALALPCVMWAQIGEVYGQGMSLHIQMTGASGSIVMRLGIADRPHVLQQSGKLPLDKKAANSFLLSRPCVCVVASYET